MALRVSDDRVPQSAVSCRAAYDAHAAGYARVLDPTLAELVERIAELATPRPGVRVLDLACGTGTIARAVARRAASVVGVDVSSRMLAVARGLSPELDFKIADAHALPFASGEFDVVTCGLALSHFHEPLTALMETLRVLRRGGRLVASAWAAGTLLPWVWSTICSRAIARPTRATCSTRKRGCTPSEGESCCVTPGSRRCR